MLGLSTLSTELLLRIVKFICFQILVNRLRLTCTAICKFSNSHRYEIRTNCIAKQGNFKIYIQRKYGKYATWDGFTARTLETVELVKHSKMRCPHIRPTLSLTHPLSKSTVGADMLTTYKLLLRDFEDFVKSPPFGDLKIDDLKLNNSLCPIHVGGLTDKQWTELQYLQIREACALKSIFPNQFGEDDNEKPQLMLTLCGVSREIMKQTYILPHTQKLVLEAKLHDGANFEILQTESFILPPSVTCLVVDGYLPYPLESLDWDSSEWEDYNSLKQIDIMGCTTDGQFILWINWFLKTNWELRLVVHSGKYNKYDIVQFSESFMNNEQEVVKGSRLSLHQEIHRENGNVRVYEIANDSIYANNCTC